MQQANQANQAKFEQTTNEADENQNVTTSNDIPPIPGVALQELMNETYPEMADVWNFVTEEDDDLMVEWARYNNK